MNWLTSLFKHKPKPMPCRFVRAVIWSMKTRSQDWARNGREGFKHLPSGMTIWSYRVDLGYGDTGNDLEIHPLQSHTSHEYRLLVRAYHQYLESPAWRRENEEKAAANASASAAVRAHFGS